MSHSYAEDDLRERLLRYERRYGMSSEEFLEAYESEEPEVVPVRRWVACQRIKGRLVSVDDAFVWVDLCHRLGIGGGD
jgi:hypothetical protein